MIARGEADVVVAGGTEAALVGLCLAAFRRMGALSRDGESRPFDTRRDGFVMGEGAARPRARARGARPRPRRHDLRARRRLRRVQRRVPHHPARRERARRGRGDDARRWPTPALAPADVGYVNAHGTSTPINDRVETIAIRRVFADDGPPVSSSKGAVGHLLGAAGAIEALACVEALRRGALPPTLGLEDIDPSARPTTSRARRARRPT